jgi:hypothetical protein
MRRLEDSQQETEMHATNRVGQSSDPMEHRWGQRVALELPVVLEIDGRNAGPGVLRDASISGALIETALELPVFTNLVVSLPAFEESAPRPAGLAACVVRCAATGIAVEWRDMACPAIVSLLERVSGRRVRALVQDEAFTHEYA